jgi:hypothetical protein
MALSDSSRGSQTPSEPKINANFEFLDSLLGMTYFTSLRSITIYAGRCADLGVSILQPIEQCCSFRDIIGVGQEFGNGLVVT